MASASSLKIKCPSCEESIRLKDESLLGKKIRCPLCKYGFEVPASLNGSKPAKPKAKKGADADSATEKSARTLAKTKKKPLDEELDDGLEESSPKKKKTGTKSKEAADEAGEDEKDGKKSKKKKSKKKKGMSDDSKKLFMFIGVGALALVVLGIAGFFLMSGGDGKTKNRTVARGPGGPGGPPGSGEKNPDDKKDPKNPDNKVPPVVNPGKKPPSLPPSRNYRKVNEVEFSQLVPNDAEHLSYTRVGAIADTPPGYLLIASFGEFGDQRILEGLGFSLDSIDAMLHATSYKKGWTWNAIHSKFKIDPKRLNSAFQLVRADDAPIKQQEYYRITRASPIVQQLRHITLANRGSGALARRTEPMYLHVLSDQQTLIIADRRPLQEFLSKDGKFDRLNDPDLLIPLPPKTGKKPGSNPGPGPGPNPGPRPGPIRPGPIRPGTGGPSPVRPGAGGPKGPVRGGGQAPQGTLQLQSQIFQGGGGFGGGNSTEKKDYTFLTISPKLREALKKAELLEDEVSPGVLYSSATDLSARGVRGGTLDRTGLWRLRQMWDVMNVMETKSGDNVNYVAVAIHKQNDSKFRFENVLLCESKTRAEMLQETLREKIAPGVAGFFLEAFRHKVEIVEDSTKKDPTTPPGPGVPGFPGPMPGGPGMPGEPGGEYPGPGGPGTTPKKKPEEPKGSHITVDAKENHVTFALNLRIEDREAKIAATQAARMLFQSIRNQVAVGFEKDSRFDLGGALVQLTNEGIQTPDISPAGYFPPAAPKVNGTPLPVWNNPVRRVSWMAHLLPFLGHKDIYQGINFYQSWKHPSNWLAARSVIPEFIDPRYPAHLQKVSYPGVPVDLGTTHVVGIAGVGADSATYLSPSEDPRGVGKRGAFGYDRLTPLETIKKNRGSLSNTAVMIQIPPDSPSGMTPWIAGGGSTVRTIPAKNSIKPFVQQHGKARGAFVIMADGSVRFVKEDVSDSVFQAMCTVGGPTPEGFDVDSFSTRVTLEKASASSKPPVKKNETGSVPPLTKKGNPVVRPAPSVRPIRSQPGAGTRSKE